MPVRLIAMLLSCFFYAIQPTTYKSICTPHCIHLQVDKSCLPVVVFSGVLRDILPDEHRDTSSDGATTKPLSCYRHPLHPHGACRQDGGDEKWSCEVDNAVRLSCLTLKVATWSGSRKGICWGFQLILLGDILHELIMDSTKCRGWGKKKQPKSLSGDDSAWKQYRLHWKRYNMSSLPRSGFKDFAKEMNIRRSI